MGSSRGKWLTPVLQIGKLCCTDEHHLCKGIEFTDIPICMGSLEKRGADQSLIIILQVWRQGVIENSVKLVIPDLKAHSVQSCAD